MLSLLKRIVVIDVYIDVVKLDARRESAPLAVALELQARRYRVAESYAIRHCKRLL
jgi:hypothetical protein